MTPTTQAAIDGLIPTWLVVASTLFFPTVVFVVVFATGSILAWALERRIDPDAHWSRQNVHSYVAMATLTRYSIMAVSLAIVFGLMAGDLHGTTGVRDAAAGGLAAIVAALLVGYLQRYRLVGYRASRLAFLGLMLRSQFAFRSHLIVFLALLPFVPRSLFDPLLWVLMTIEALACWVAIYKFRTFATALGVVGPPPEKLTRAAASLVDGDGPDLLQMESYLANAYATAHANAILFTRPAIELLDEDEIAGVVAHEMAHIREPSATRRRRAARVFLLVPLLALPAIINELGLVALVGFVALLVLLAVILRRQSRQLESDADAEAHLHGPIVFARALEKIYRHNRVSVVTPPTTTHPALYDRMEAAGYEPGYRRPLLPRSAGILALLLASLSSVAILGFAGYATDAGKVSPDIRTKYLWRAERDADPFAMWTLARMNATDGDLEGAYWWTRGAFETETSMVYAMQFAEYAAATGRCDEVGLAHQQVTALTGEFEDNAWRHQRIDELRNDCVTSKE